MGTDNVQILYWLLGFSYFLHLIAAAVGIWDRLRLKPGIIERLSHFLHLDAFREYKTETDQRIRSCAQSKDLERLIVVTDKRFERMSEAIKAEQKSNQQLFRDLIESIGRLEGAIKNQ